jgi:hypothetical protein
MILKKKFYILLILLIVDQSFAFAQSIQKTRRDIDSSYKYRLSFPVIILSNIGNGGDRTNTQHIELHFKYNLDSKNIFGVKFATWRLFQPMGIQWSDGLLDKIESQSEFYPGYLRETGLGISYQRMIWKGLFAAVEILPLSKTYLDLNKSKISKGFKIYTSYHIGYHIPLFKNRMFIEPQIHCQNWMIDTNTPSQFKELDGKWRNHFLFEPNIYFGVKF